MAGWMMLDFWPTLMMSGAWEAAASAVKPPREFPATMASALTTSLTNAHTCTHTQKTKSDETCVFVWETEEKSEENKAKNDKKSVKKTANLNEKGDRKKKETEQMDEFLLHLVTPSLRGILNDRLIA